MLPGEVKRRAVAEARRRNVSFANFVRQALADKLPDPGNGSNRLKRRRQDPLFRLFENLPSIKAATPTDTAVNHDDYLYGRKSDIDGR